MSRLTVSFVDYNRESSAASINVRPVTGSYATWLEDVEAVEQFIKNVSIALPTKTTWSQINQTASPGAAASSPDAQRETKWLVSYYDTVTFKRYSFEIPGADLTLLQENSEFMDLSVNPGFGLKANLDAEGRSPDGNTIVVTSVKHVGRNI